MHQLVSYLLYLLTLLTYLADSVVGNSLVPPIIFLQCVPPLQGIMEGIGENIGENMDLGMMCLSTKIMLPYSAAVHF